MVDNDGNHSVACGVQGVLPYLDPELEGEVGEPRKCRGGGGGGELVIFSASRGRHFVNICERLFVIVVDER